MGVLRLSATRSLQQAQLSKHTGTVVIRALISLCTVENVGLIPSYIISLVVYIE